MIEEIDELMDNDNEVSDETQVLNTVKLSLFAILILFKLTILPNMSWFLVCLPIIFNGLIISASFMILSILNVFYIYIYKKSLYGCLYKWLKDKT